MKTRLYSIEINDQEQTGTIVMKIRSHLKGVLKQLYLKFQNYFSSYLLVRIDDWICPDQILKKWFRTYLYVRGFTFLDFFDIINFTYFPIIWSFSLSFSLEVLDFRHVRLKCQKIKMIGATEQIAAMIPTCIHHSLIDIFST